MDLWVMSLELYLVFNLFIMSHCFVLVTGLFNILVFRLEVIDGL